MYWMTHLDDHNKFLKLTDVSSQLTDAIYPDLDPCLIIFKSWKPLCGVVIGPKFHTYFGKYRSDYVKQISLS